MYFLSATECWKIFYQKHQISPQSVSLQVSPQSRSSLRPRVTTHSARSLSSSETRVRGPWPGRSGRPWTGWRRLPATSRTPGGRRWGSWRGRVRHNVITDLRRPGTRGHSSTWCRASCLTCLGWRKIKSMSYQVFLMIELHFLEANSWDIFRNWHEIFECRILSRYRFSVKRYMR